MWCMKVYTIVSFPGNEKNVYFCKIVFCFASSYEILESFYQMHKKYEMFGIQKFKEFINDLGNSINKFTTIP